MASAGFGGRAETSAFSHTMWLLAVKVRNKCIEVLVLLVKHNLRRLKGQVHSLASSFCKDFINHPLLPGSAGHQSSEMHLFLGDIRSDDD